MNLLADEAVVTANELRPLVKDYSDIDIVVCPTTLALTGVAKALRKSTIALGAQNCYCEEKGAFTGEVSPQMLLDAGCTWVILGHSERRQHFYESDTLLNKKVRFALGAGLNVMFCIGETLDERNSGDMNDVLTRQVTAGLRDIKPELFRSLAIAYEPVWAIGTGVTATTDQAEEAHRFIRGLIAKEFGAEVAEALRIQYGGSVKPDNAAELLALENVDGALVGGASLHPEQFASIVGAALKEA